MSGFVRSIEMSHCGNGETGQNALCGRYLNNRRTGKDATKSLTLGLLGHSVIATTMSIGYLFVTSCSHSMSHLDEYDKERSLIETDTPLWNFIRI